MSKDAFLANMGKRVSQQRKKLSLTQEQLAEKMSVSLQTISCIELGKKAIRPENLANLCKVLDISSDYILYGKRNETQINDTIEKLTELDSESYQVIENMIEVLYNKQKNREQ